MSIKYFFDFQSPFSYLSWKLLNLKYSKLIDEIEFHPLAMGQLIHHYETKGPAEIAPKRDYLMKFCLRFAKKNSIDFNIPKQLPFNSSPLLRLAISAEKNDKIKVIECLFNLVWKDNIALDDPEQIINSLTSHKIDAESLWQRSLEKDVRRELKNNFKMAIENKVFGVPSFIVNDELFWGSDSLEDLNYFLSNEDPLDHSKMQKFNQLLDQVDI